MGNNVIARTVPAQVTCESAMIDMSRDESVLVLIKHCRDMKQQETRLRFITLLLLFSCAALYCFTVRTDFRETSAGSPAYAKQDRVCPTDNQQTNSQRLHIHLGSSSEKHKADRVYVKWSAQFGEQYNEEKRAIVIPEDGIYFVYVRIALSCYNEAPGFVSFNAALHNWNQGYNKTVILMDALDGLTCSSEGFKSVFVGRLFDLLKGDHVSVWIEEGYKLITKSAFGAYLT